ncbi:MAG TPA: hypothetical protein VHS52_04160 [Acidimicrobiales bacterium]|nr:hypothetical protein [Acidimicrobiales bacterium]
MAPVLVAVIAATLVTDAGVVLARSGDDGPHTPPAHAAPPPPDVVPDKLQPVLPELEAFVEQARGLRFERPPKVSLVGDDEFEKLLDGDGSDTGGQQDAQTALGVLRALGLVEGNVDIQSVGRKQDSQTVGFYDDQTTELYVRGVDATPYAEDTLVHELTHALDDQHFGLARPELDKPDQGDAQTAFQALVEGDAVTVETAWYDSRSKEDRDAIDAAETAAGGGADNGSEPDVFTKLLAFPYSVGPSFVAAVRESGGQARLDATFERPPTTTEQILYPKRFLAGEGAVAVPAPPADGKVVDEGSLGELGLFLVADATVSHQDAGRASTGWGGDAYRAWRDGDRTCIRVNIQMDTPTDTAQLLDALATWSAKHPGSTVSGRDPIVITNCG